MSQNLPSVKIPVNPVKKIKIDNEPSTIDEFVKMRDEIATTPEGGAAMFVLAMRKYQANPDQNISYLIVSIDQSRLEESQGEQSYKGYTIAKSDMWTVKTQLTKNNYLANSYFKGTSSQNGYAAKPPFVVECERNQYSNIDNNTVKVFVRCSGADTPRPITMAKNDKGIWKAKEFSSLLVGVKAPPSNAKDDL
ncbi:MAG: hypothetical protein NZ455_11050 [Bacteroidia bacterium]|nr:hypothetical protein [Bacteroidia bacterium]MDW8348342.1 hypothetical protein [Bacteroidia bacterium]